MHVWKLFVQPPASSQPTQIDQLLKKDIGVVSLSLKASSQKAENIYTHNSLIQLWGFVCLFSLFFFIFLALFFPSLFFFFVLFLFFPPKKRLFWIMLRFPILPIFGQKSTLCMHQPREISLQIHKLGLEWGLFWTKLLIASVLSVQDMNEFYIHSEVIWATSH